MLGALPAGAITCQDVLGESVNPRVVSYVRHNDFVIDRTLSEYKALLAPPFWEKLIQLSKSGRQGHWADFGSGELLAARALRAKNLNARSEPSGLPLTDLQELLKYSLEERPRVTAFTAVVPPGLPSIAELESQQIRLLDGFFENIRAEDFEEFDLGTDVHGIFAYTNRLSESLQKALRRMKKDGLFVMYAGAINERVLTQAEATYVELPDGTRISLREWFFRIEGLKVNLAANQSNDSFSILMRKTDSPIRIPVLEPLPLPEKPRTGEEKFIFQHSKVRHFKETENFLIVD